jgi:hypothetical protein
MCVLGLCQLSTAERTGYALRGKSVRCDKSPVPSKITIITSEKNREYVAAIQDLLRIHYSGRDIGLQCSTHSKRHYDVK